MLRTTAGARALMVLAGVILAVALLALVVNVFRGGDEPPATTASTSTTAVEVQVERLSPIRIDCTSQLAAFPCEALIDDDPTNSYNATEGGVGAEITLLFSPPKQITSVFFHNLEDEERFLRNARIKGVEILVDDLEQSIVAELDDTNTPQEVTIGSIRTSSLKIRITSAYPGQSYQGHEPFPELALQEINFFGRDTPDGG